MYSGRWRLRSSPPVMNRPAEASASTASGRKDQNIWKAWVIVK